MKTWFALGIGVAFALTAGTARADDASVASDLIKNLCSNCHGENGVSESPTFPNLAGQQEEYIENQIKSFRDRKRADPHAQAYMWGMASNPKLTDGVIEHVAKYFSEQKPPHGKPASDAALSERGKDLFLHGAPKRDIPECAQCHGTDGAGKDSIPRLAGQHKEYLVTQIAAFQKNLRENPLMHENSSHLTEDDIEALTTYLSSQ